MNSKLLWFPGIFCPLDQKISGAITALVLAISAPPQAAKVPDTPVD
jgi:hypothetical protein